MKNYDEILETLNSQKKQVEAQFLKIEGAIEIVTSMKGEDTKKAKPVKKEKV
jgi:hypothetical protein|tara:strand:- start:3700 stop:3855 length:156 start_codon:yes stop_codon:yes gene_type:complete